MPSDESIEGVAVGNEFVVVSTNMRDVRLYTASGIFRFIFTAEGRFINFIIV